MKDEIFQAEYRTRMTRSMSDEEMAREMYDAGKPKWIPVSERLPDKDGWYLVWGTMSRYARVDFYDGTWNVTTVAAWQPLPTPYTEGE